MADPVITSDPQTAEIEEIVDLGTGENVDPHQRSGAVTFTDPTPLHEPTASKGSQSVVYVDNEGGGTLPGAGTSEATFKSAFSVQANGSWTYSIGDSALDFLAAGETVTVTSTVVVSDGVGGTASEDVTVTLTGTNDAPVFTDGPATSGPLESLTEGSDQTGSETLSITASGGLAFGDVDLSDAHTASDAYVSAAWTEAGAGSIPAATLDALALPGTMTVSIGNEATGDGTGSASWSFALADKFADFLAAGETLNVTYDITVSDGQGGSDTEQVTVVITGANDTPTATGETANTSEDGTSVIHAKTITGNVLTNDSDVDLNDTLVVSAAGAGETGTLEAGNVGVEITGLYGTLTLLENGDYSYSFFNTNDIIAGEAPDDIFHYEISDGNGGTADATLTINIAGTDLDLTITPAPADPHDADPFVAQRGNDIIGGTVLADTIFGGDGNDELYGSTGTDSLYGEEGTDQLFGGDDADLLSGAAGNDVVQGEAGNDTIVGGSGAGFDVYDGGADTDTLDYSSTSAGIVVDLTATDRSAQAIAGGPGLTTIGALLLAAGYAADQAVGKASGSEIDVDAILNVENVIGGSGADTITGDDNVNQLNGGGGGDTLRGAGGADRLFGEAGGDTLYGDAGNDYVEGGGANDVIAGGLNGGDGYDVYDGGSETDTVDYSATTLGVTIDLNAAGREFEAVLNPDGGGPNPDTIGALLASVGLSTTISVARADGAEIATDALIGIENAIGGSGADSIIGDAGNNVLEGRGGIDQVWGRAGDDTIYGGEGGDILVGGFGGNSILASGNDTIYGEGGDDQLFGEDGSDSLSGGNGADQYAGGAGNDTLYFEADNASDTAWGGTDGDTFVFLPGSGTDTIKDFLTVGLAADKIDLRAFPTASLSSIIITQVGSNVEITGFSAGSKIVLEVVNAASLTASNFIFAPNNVIVGTSSGETLQGTEGSDIIRGLGGNDTLRGLGGADSLDGGTGNDTMFGGLGSDIYFVDSTSDVVNETDGDGRDMVISTITFSLSSTTQIVGQVEDLLLNGSAAINGTGNALANTITGNSAANTLAGLGGEDMLDGAGGTDTASYAASKAGVNVSLVAGILGVGGDADGDLLFNIENLMGSNLDDILEGNSGNNVMAGGASGAYGDTVSYARATAGVTVSLAVTNSQNTGGAGTDSLTGFENVLGSSFIDKLTGSTGANKIDGGLGNDMLAGGKGADFFVFSTTLGPTNIDTITDLTVVDDTIYLSSGVFSALTALGTLTAGAFKIGTAANEADDRIIYDRTSGALYYDSDGLGGNAQVQFAKLNANLSLTAADFVVI